MVVGWVQIPKPLNNEFQLTVTQILMVIQILSVDPLKFSSTIGEIFNNSLIHCEDSIRPVPPD